MAEHPEEAGLRTVLAEALTAQGSAMAKTDPVAAEVAYREVLTLAADRPGVLNDLAWLLRDRPEARAEAIGYVERALALKPTSGAAWDTLAELRFRAGDIEGALDANVQAAAHDPDRRALYEARRVKYEAARD